MAVVLHTQTPTTTQFILHTPIIKLHPPNLLSPKQLTQQQFNIWSIELQLQLGHDKILSHFLPDRLFPAYESEEINQHKISFLSSVNPDRPRPRYLNCDSKVTIDQRTALLTRLHRHYQVFLYQVGKFLSDRVVYNSTWT